MLTGEFIDAQTAFSWGIVNELLAPDRLLQRCLEIGSAIAAADQECIQLLQETLCESKVAQQDPMLDAERSALERFDEARRTPR